MTKPWRTSTGETVVVVDAALKIAHPAGAGKTLGVVAAVLTFNGAALAHPRRADPGDIAGSACVAPSFCVARPVCVADPRFA